MNNAHNARARYSQGAIALHWILAILILLNFVFIAMAEDMAEVEKARFAGYHMANGLLILGLTVVRIAWRAIHPKVGFASTLKAWEATLATIVHWLFYVLMLGIPLAGWAMVSAFSGGRPIGFFGLFDIPGLPLPQDKAMADGLHQVHGMLALLMLLLFVLHVVAALKHRFIDRDDTMGRMVPGR